MQDGCRIDSGDLSLVNIENRSSAATFLRRPAFAAKTKTAGSFNPAVQNSLALNPASTKAQPAFFSGAAAAVFFSIARFSSSARGDSSVGLALSKNASRPPR